MTRLPLLVHPSPDTPVAWRGGHAVSRARFVADVRHVAAAMPPGRHVLNACSDRYRFAVGLAAALVSGRTSLLPAGHTTDVQVRMREFAADTFVLVDVPPVDGPLPCMRFPELPATVPADAADDVPLVDAAQTVAWAFTSGSTGRPAPHRKTWGAFVRNVRAEAEALGLADGPPPTFVGTVPPQHMYGLESTVLIALQTGGAFDAGRPFFPADVREAVARARAPAVLVTTPFHLRAVLAEDGPLPSPALLVSATAPLSEAVAREAEARFGAPLLEIYGCTESGQLATRRTSATDTWQAMPGVRLEAREDRVWALGGHVETPVPLGDHIELADPGRFRLGGRMADLVNIAGRRTSLAWLDHQLAAIEGVRDGAFFLPSQAPGSVEDIVRLAAFVVAPAHDASTLMAALRERIEPIFLPRPLLLLDRLPRNATGKLPREAAEALLAEHARGSAGRA